MPKGNGKTPLVAAIGAYELAGGDHVSPVVPVSAATFDQADLLFGDMKTMFRESATLSQYATVFDTEIMLKGQPGRAFRVAAARGSNDGARPTCYVADELHEFNDPAKEGAHLVLANGCAKRADSLQINVTTAGADLDSLLGRLYLKGRRIESGEEKDDTFLFIWFEADPDLDITNDEALRKAIRQCNPAADDFLDVEEIAGRFTAIPEFEARRYYLNQWTRTKQSWLPIGTWEACEGSSYIPPHADVTVGVDLSLKQDSTAVVVAWPHRDTRGTNVVTVQSRVWLPTDGRIDHSSVKAHLRALHKQFVLTRVIVDPTYFQIMGEELADEGLPIQDEPQTHERMVPACASALNLILDRRLIHDGDATLTDHVLSAATRETDHGWRLSKGRSKRKIDACIAMVMATSWAVRSDPEPQPPAQLIYY